MSGSASASFSCAAQHPRQGREDGAGGVCGLDARCGSSAKMQADSGADAGLAGVQCLQGPGRLRRRVAGQYFWSASLSAPPPETPSPLPRRYPRPSCRTRKREGGRVLKTDDQRSRAASCRQALSCLRGERLGAEVRGEVTRKGEVGSKSVTKRRSRHGARLTGMA